MHDVDSGLIARAGYDDYEMILELKDGRAYQYSGMPKIVFDAFLDSKSKGRFFNAEIRGRYETTRLA